MKKYIVVTGGAGFVGANLIEFLIKKTKYKIISFFAKKARGSMARFIVQNKIKKVEDLNDFNLDGYSYSKNDSETNKPVFLRKS